MRKPALTAARSAGFNGADRSILDLSPAHLDRLGDVRLLPQPHSLAPV